MFASWGSHTSFSMYLRALLTDLDEPVGIDRFVEIQSRKMRRAYLGMYPS